MISINKSRIRIKLYLVLIIFSVTIQNLKATAYWDDKGIMLDNGSVSRYISFVDNQIKTTILKLSSKNLNFVSDAGGGTLLEFSIKVNGEILTGLSGWEVEKVTELDNKLEQGATLVLKGHGLMLKIKYILYPNQPVIRKSIEVTNLTDSELKLEEVDVESLNIPWGNTHDMIYRNYARNKWIGTFIGNWDDPLVALHDQRAERGILLGNESPGVLKRTTACLDGSSVTIGLTHLDHDYPFRTWLKNGESWESPYTFILPYMGKDPGETIQGVLSDFVRHNMGIRLAELDNRPTFVYNTWNPFRTKINEKLIYELADAAAACGVEEFVIDDGWANNMGDWEIDPAKFPNGLKPVFDYIKSKGMKPGLWLSLATINEESKILKEHPEWLVLDKNGRPTNVHSNAQNKYTVCMTTGWKEYIKNTILNLVKDHGLEYVKLDLAVVTGAYMFNRENSGCYAPNHSHKDREESLLEIYRNTWDLFDELHKEAPNLFIDCTFETMGALQMIDYDMCKHAEGNWLSNFEEKVPSGSLRVRQMGWWRSGIIPATALVIGNQTMDDPNWELSFQSLLGTLPILLGDPRNVSPENQDKMKMWSHWMKEMQSKFDYDMYRQDVQGFGEPTEGEWDAWARINTDTKQGGIFGVFRQGGYENARTVRVKGLKEDANYGIYLAPEHKYIQSLSGKNLKENGVEIIMNEKYGSRIFSVEIERAN